MLDKDAFDELVKTKALYIFTDSGAQTKGTMTGPRDTNRNLETVFALVSENELYPWKIRYKRSLDLNRFSLSDTKEDLSKAMKNCFLHIARSGSLKPYEFMLSEYIFFGNGLDSVMVSVFQLFFNIPRHMRVETHNLWIPHLFPYGIRDVRGPGVGNLKHPLLPPSLLDDMNEKVFDARVLCNEGGGRDRFQQDL